VSRDSFRVRDVDAAHAARAACDSETGVVRVLQVAAYAVNPLGARGQVLCGVVIGIGQTLSEGMQLDESRQLNPHLLDDKLVTCADAPRIDIVFVDNPSVNGGQVARGMAKRRAGVSELLYHGTRWVRSL
jgi:CO/xanthine dehydrogenase Mo-binding subunit